MNLQKIVDKFLEKPYALDMGSKKLSVWWDFPLEDIKAAKKILRKQLKLGRKRSDKGVKILLLDVEVAPMKAWIWRLWKNYVPYDEVEADWFCLSWSVKWLFGDTITSDKLTPKEALAEDDGRILKSVWKFLDEADIIITFNGDQFDLPRLNTRFLIYDILPPSPYKSIDAFKIAKKIFHFSSNSLDNINKILNLGQKEKNDGFSLWKSCLEGDPNALLAMEKYNRRDVEILEELYLRIRPWIPSHPNLGLYYETENSVCSHCLSEDIVSLGVYCTSVSKYETFRCNNCGAVLRKRLNTYNKDFRKNLVVSIPGR